MAEAKITSSVDAQCTSKRAYIFKEKAERVAARRMKDGSGPLRVYKCSHCGFFHLTSKPLNS